MDKEALQDRLVTTHMTLAQSLIAAHAVTNYVTAARNTLAERKAEQKAAEAAAYLSDLQGKNEKARAGEVFEITTPEREAVQEAETHVAHIEAQVAEAHLDVTLATNEHRLARDLLRLHTSPEVDA